MFLSDKKTCFVFLKKTLTFCFVFALAINLFGIYNFNSVPKVFASGSWLSGWSYRKAITISHTNVGTSDLSDFPLLVKITTDSDMSSALANGNDVRFTSSDGATLLSYERESWSGGNGSAATGVFWVKVPTISHTADTNIYIYYGNSGASDGQNTTDVWDSNYKGVWHLGSSLTADSTSNINNGTNSSVTAATDGQIYNGGNFVSSGNISVTNNISVSNFTISTWFKSNGGGAWSTFACKEEPNYNHSGGGLSRNYWFGLTNTGSVGVLYSGGGNPNEGNLFSTSTYADGNWHLAEATYDGTNINIYVDGVSRASPVTASAPDTMVSNTTFGDDPPDADQYTGELNEIHISNISRSANWVNFEYCNEMSSTSSTCAVPTGGYASNEITLASQELPPVTSITVSDAKSGTVINGGTDQISATVLPSNSKQTVAWSVTNGTGSATIDSSTGLLTATGAGNVTVTASATDSSGINGSEQITITTPTCPSISNAATYNAYPTCGVATCQTGYALTNGNCVASGGGGGSIPPQWLQPPTAPVGGFNILINNGATSTANPAVTLNLQAGSDTARMAVSNFSDFRDAGQENYAQSKIWNLCWTSSMLQNPSTCPAGTYNVYAKFYTQYGQSSAPISASIVLRGNSLDGPTQTTSGFTFTKRLQLGMNMMDVKYLQIILNSDKDTQIAISGVGSFGHETTKFGFATYNAVKRFQKKYANEILVPQGFKSPTGIVGLYTNKKLNSMLSVLGQ